MQYFKNRPPGDIPPVDRPISLAEIDEVSRNLEQFRNLLREKGTHLETTSTVLVTTYEINNRAQGRKMVLTIHNHGTIFPGIELKTSDQTD